MNCSRKISLFLVLAIASIAAADLKPTLAKSKLSAVTLYRSQALVVRAVDVPAGTGEMALTVNGLPAAVDPASLFASSPDLKIRSVRYFTEYETKKLPTDKIAPLEAKLKAIAIEKTTLSTKGRLLSSKESYLQLLERQYLAKLGTTTTNTTAGSKTTGFDFKTITEMTEYLNTQKELLMGEKLGLAAEARKLDDARQDITDQINVLRYGKVQAGSANPQARNYQARPSRGTIHRKATIYLAKSAPGKASLSLSYIVSGASWTPAYNMRTTAAGATLNLEYLAHVRQTTGEDWDGVKLTLSTATPNMSAEIPMLAPLRVNLVATPKSPGNSIAIYSSMNQSATNMPLGNGSTLVVDNVYAQTIRAQKGTLAKFQKKAGQSVSTYNYDLNRNANNWQGIEFGNKITTLRRWSTAVRQVEQQMAVEYNIPDTVTLASRNDNQMVQILSEDLKCNLYYEAVPLLASYVSRGIEAKNTIAQPLLAGKYSAFLDGQYVGAGSVPVTATGQSLVLGFGVDPQLRCRRQLADKTGDKSWGSRIETYQYRLVLDNFKSRPVSVRLLDRIPITEDKGLAITLRDGKDTLSTDENYLDIERPRGILRWDITLPASTAGAKATKFNYSFDMKFDSDMQISTQTQKLLKQLEFDVQELQESKRFKAL
ncbi:MAG: mucoidy inhibitor MuiA family protein [Phycisphaerales bacterium]|jgi:hypothetical protein|nr:mucoidy inhibitor MuiA family protein [Phycisphaerales bacterium]MBT7171790.1 mucoidy inhibitor MuiA family protein [Phycisphaerales bacterium]